MRSELEHSADEIKRLQRCINDLISVLALPAMWSDREPLRIVHGLLDALLGMLRLDLVYVHLKDPDHQVPIQLLRVAPGQEAMARPEEICELLSRWFQDAPQTWPSPARAAIGDRDVSLLPLRLGLQGELGFIVAGSERADFPGQTEKLVLSVAANQGAIGLQEARLRSQLKRFAGELDARVAQRTAELAAANEALRNEIAGRQRAEKALQVRECDLRLIVDSIPAPVALMTPGGEVEAVNQPTLQYFGKTFEDLKNWGSGDAVHPDDLPHVIDVWEEAIKTGRPYEIKERLRRFDGVYHWFDVRGFPLRDHDGRILNWCVLLIDIDDRQRAEEALRRGEVLMAESQRLSLTGSFMWRPVNDEITWSKQLYRIFEFEQGRSMTLELIESRIHPEDRPTFKELVELCRRNSSDFQIEFRLQLPDRSIRYIHVVAHNRPDDNGQLEYIGAVQDVTERRHAEEALARAQSELTRVARITSLGVLTASMAHEVNQPLFGIITNASTCLSMLSADPPNIDGARETARRTIRDGNRASDVITRLRTLYSKKDPSPESMDLNEATREVISLSLRELHRHRVILRQELADDLPLITADRVQVQQVIMNLLRNASDAMSNIDDRPRDLLIRTERDEDDRVTLSVQDAGVGFEPQAVDRLFEAFYTTKKEGMGIGLSISHSIIEAHGGRLWATANDGPGATFSFSLPCRAAADETGPNWPYTKGAA